MRSFENSLRYFTIAALFLLALTTQAFAFYPNHDYGWRHHYNYKHPPHHYFWHHYHWYHPHHVSHW